MGLPSLFVAVLLAVEIARVDFERELDGWRLVSESGSIALDGERYFSGLKSLRIGAEEKSSTKVSSPDFKLESWTIYRVSFQLWRTQLVRVNFSIVLQPSGGEVERALSLGSTPRIPPPEWTEWTGYFATMDPQETGRFLIEVSGGSIELGRCLWIDDFRLLNVRKVLLESSPNLIWDGDFARSSKLPRDWTVWRKSEKIALKEDRSGRFLSSALDPVDRWSSLTMPLLQALTYRAYEFTLETRGKGTVVLGIRKLKANPLYPDKKQVPLRIGWVKLCARKIHSTQWKLLSLRFVIESPAIDWIQPYISFCGSVDIDKISLARIGH